MGVPKRNLEGYTPGMVIHLLPRSNGEKVGGGNVGVVPNYARDKTPPNVRVSQGASYDVRVKASPRLAYDYRGGMLWFVGQRGKDGY